MRWPLIFMAMLLAGAPVAQAQDDKVELAYDTAQTVMPDIAAAIIVTETCGIGDRQEWEKVIGAIDRRFRYCSAKDPSWKALLKNFVEAEEKSLKEGSSRSLGSFVAELGRRSALSALKSLGKDGFCAARPWKMLLGPTKVTAEDKAQFLKAHPDYLLDQDLAVAAFILGLGTDAAWIEAPCDKFWPL